MILPVVRERLERLLRLSAVEGALGALRSGESKIQLSGLQSTAKALLATYLAGELRRPAFFLVASNKQAESIAETCASSPRYFPPATSLFFRRSIRAVGCAQPHADILERRAATLFRLATGQASFVVAPVSAALWRYRSYDSYEILTRTLKTDDEVSLDAFIAYLGAVGYARTEMVEMPASLRNAAVSWIFSRRKRRAPSASNYSVTLSSPSASLTRALSAPSRRSFAPPFFRSRMGRARRGDGIMGPSFLLGAERGRGSAQPARTRFQRAQTDRLPRRTRRHLRKLAPIPRRRDGNLRTPWPHELANSRSFLLARRKSADSPRQCFTNPNGRIGPRRRR